MKILIGTTNKSKIGRFKSFLPYPDIEFLTLNDLGITAEPEEKGHTPKENAIIKAKFYGKFCDKVICNDSGLYFENIPLDDARQPGLNIRTPMGEKRLDDEEMISYYSHLIESLGGKVAAFYMDGIAVYNNGKIASFMEADMEDTFYMVSTPSENRHEGWPLDSISINKNTMTYFTDAGNNIYDNVQENIMIGEYRNRLISFLETALDIKKNQYR